MTILLTSHCETDLSVEAIRSYEVVKFMILDVALRLRLLQ